MRYFSEYQGALEPKSGRRFLQELETTEGIGPNPLGGTFKATQGIGWTLTTPGFGIIQQRLPTIAVLLEAMGLPHGPTPLRSFWQKLRGYKCNAFYLNVLVIPPGKAIAPHIDATLRDKAHNHNLLPTCVSVLWLELPGEFDGGQLRLYDQARPITAVAPKVGKIVHFQGHLRHEVTPMKLAHKLQPGPARRISLVCERYRLPEALVQKLKPISPPTHKSFGTYLQKAKSKPLVRFELD